MADDPEEKPEGDAPADASDEPSSQETAVGHSVVEEPSGEEPARETAVGHSVVEADLNPQPLPPAAESQPAAAPAEPSRGTSPAGADREAAEAHDQFEQKPEIFIAGAFVGAFVIAKLLKKLTRGDD